MPIAFIQRANPLCELLRRYNLSMDHRSSGGETREPIFRSDLEGPRPEPRYEPLRPEGGLWSVIKRWIAPLAAVGLVLAKFKGLALLLLKVKFLGTALTMLVSIGAYALLFPVWFAVGIVVLIWVHEMGHVLQLRREGIPASAPMFIPFLGAFVAMKRMPKDALAEARVGLAGPVLGTLGGLATLGFTPPRGAAVPGARLLQLHHQPVQPRAAAPARRRQGRRGDVSGLSVARARRDGRAVLCGPDHGFDRATRTA